MPLIIGKILVGTEVLKALKIILDHCTKRIKI